MPAPIKRPKRAQAPAATTPAPRAPKRPVPSIKVPQAVVKKPVAAALDMTKIKVTPEWVDINDIVPYVYNARDNSKAIAAVKKSIQNFGFLVPVVIDKDGNLAAGHTRTEAAKELGMAEVLAVRAEHLTTDQIDAFRLIDNKVSEIADWDTSLLAPELARLEGVVDFTDFGWNQEEIDCMSSLVAADCLSLDNLAPPPAAVEEGEEEEGRLSTRRGPSTTRFVLGELVLYVPTTAYKDWIDGLQRRFNFTKPEIEAEILNRLGIMQ